MRECHWRCRAVTQRSRSSNACIATSAGVRLRWHHTLRLTTPPLRQQHCSNQSNEFIMWPSVNRARFHSDICWKQRGRQIFRRSERSLKRQWINCTTTVHTALYLVFSSFAYDFSSFSYSTLFQKIEWWPHTGSRVLPPHQQKEILEWTPRNLGGRGKLPFLENKKWVLLINTHTYRGKKKCMFDPWYHSWSWHSWSKNTPTKCGDRDGFTWLT